jgi:hypothetical protein
MDVNEDEELELKQILDLWNEDSSIFSSSNITSINDDIIPLA